MVERRRQNGKKQVHDNEQDSKKDNDTEKQQKQDNHENTKID